MKPLFQPHPDSARPPDGGELSIAVLLRLAADDELTPDQRSRLEAHLKAHPEDAARIDFERSLRSACSRACCPGCCAPADLRARIAAAANAMPGVSAAQDVERGPGGAGRGPFRLSAAVARFVAAAALVAVVATAGFLAGRADYLAEPSGSVVPPPTGRLMGASLARFVRNEHLRCTEGGPAIDSKFTVSDPGEVPEQFGAIIGRPVTLPCIEQADERGLRFVDAGLCHPPGGEAMHIRFRPDEGAGPLVSLWVQLDDGTLQIEDGITYTMGEGADRIRFWRVDGIRYVLVCPDEAAAPAVSLALASPTAIRPF